MQTQATKRRAYSAYPDNDVRSRLSATDSCATIFESPKLNTLLCDQNSIPQRLVDLLAESKVIYKSASVGVFRVSEDIVVKITAASFATTEHASLVYLQEHLRSFPAPRPYGLVRMGAFYLLFTSFVPGIDLEKAWTELEDSQKRDISVQLDELLRELRLLPYPANMTFGGVDGKGCKDARRSVRANSQPIQDNEQFEDFLFSGSNTASPLYIKWLRGLIEKSSSNPVFTHADLRPANIMVERAEDGSWRVAAVVDWEASGFYPDYWESVKITNTLAPTETFDWYEYLPECVSPKRYSSNWLVDRLWDRNMVNS